MRTERRSSLLVAALVACLLGPGCSDDVAAPTDARLDSPTSDAASDGPRADLPEKPDGAGDRGPSDGKVADRNVPPDGPTADLPSTPDSGGVKLPPPPPGAIVLRISVDDSAAKTYAGGELFVKGAFSYDAKTNVITPDATWSGPSVPLWDEGAGGREGPGSTSGDHRLGTVVYLAKPSSSTTIDYGIESPAGWMWPQSGGNAKVTVTSSSPATVDLTGFAVPPRAGVDLVVHVDASQLSGTNVNPGHQVVALRGTATHWAPLACNDHGEHGDVKAADGRFTCKLSAHLGKGRRFPHLGLVQPGQAVSFLIDIAGGGYKKTAGVSVELLSQGKTSSASLSVGSDGNLNVSVPAALVALQAPAAEQGPLPAGKLGAAITGRQELTAAGIKGWFYVPSWYDAHRPLPLLLALHGLGEQGIWMINVWEQLAEDHGFILVAASALGSNKSWNWIYQKTPSEEQPLLSAVKWIRARYNVDPGRVAVEGFSDGASMALRMGLAHPDVFHAIVTNSPWTTGPTFKNTPSVAVYITHGEADKVLSFANAKLIRDNLAAKGYAVKHTWFPLGHAYEHHVFPTDYKVPFLRWLASVARP